MKTLRISDISHRKLTAIVGKLVAQKGKMQTYEDAIEVMLNQSIILPPELLAEIEKFIAENKRLGFTTREEFICDAARWRLKFLNENFKYVEVPRDKCEKFGTAIKEINIPYHNASVCIQTQAAEVSERYKKWLEKGHTKRNKREVEEQT